MKTYEGPAKARIACRKPKDTDCPNDFVACGAECLDCKHHELMVLDRGNVVGKGLLAERPAPEPEPAEDPVEDPVE